MKRSIVLCSMALLLLALSACDKNPTVSINEEDKAPVYVKLLGKMKLGDGTVYETKELTDIILPKAYWVERRAFSAGELGIKPESQGGLRVNSPDDIYLKVFDGNVFLAGGSFAYFLANNIGTFNIVYTDYRIEPYIELGGYSTSPLVTWKQSSFIVDCCDGSCSSQTSPNTSKTAQVSPPLFTYSGAFSDWNVEGFFASICDQKADVAVVQIDLRDSAAGSSIIINELFVHFQGI